MHTRCAILEKETSLLAFSRATRARKKVKFKEANPMLDGQIVVVCGSESKRET